MLIIWLPRLCCNVIVHRIKTPVPRRVTTARGLGGTPRGARWGVVANGSNGEMGSLCTIDLNPIVSRDSMLFSLLFDDRVAVKPSNRAKNYGTVVVASKSAVVSGSAQRVCKMAGQQRAGAFPSKKEPFVFLHGAKPEQQTLWLHRSDK